MGTGSVYPGGSLPVGAVARPSSTSNGDAFQGRRRPGTRRMGREPLELPRRPRAANAGKRVEHVSSAHAWCLRRAQLPEAGDVLAVRVGQRFTIQIGDDLDLVGA